MKDLKTATSEDLRAFLDNSLWEDNEDWNLFDCLAVMAELKRRRGDFDTEEGRMRWKMTVEYYYPVSLREDEELTDPATGILLTPSWHGEKCQGNGEHPGKECCCDECDHYLACFPDWKTHTT